MSFIYDELPITIDKESLGYFETKVETFSEIEPKENFSLNLSGTKSINKDTLVVYFCGAFTLFHEGHYNLIVKAYTELKTEDNDVRIIISPANSSYIFEKYGPEYNVGNKVRLERIVNLLNEKQPSFLEDIVIDMNPMLNTTCDFNFTDILKSYIEKYIPYEELDNVPYILCGKDHGNFKDLELYTDKIRIFFDTGCNTSSSANLRLIGDFKKKKIILRVHNKKEFEVFKRFMEPYYESIQPFLISDECKYVSILATKLLASGKYENVFTNCKNYRELLPYVRIQRKFKHPLDLNPSVESEPLKPNSIFIDSDMFSGGTKKHVNSFGSELTCLYDLRLKQDTDDIVDIDDLYKSDFRYPYNDLSERMGLPIFETRTHRVIENLKAALNFI